MEKKGDIDTKKDRFATFNSMPLELVAQARIELSEPSNSSIETCIDGKF